MESAAAPLPKTHCQYEGSGEWPPACIFIYVYFFKFSSSIRKMTKEDPVRGAVLYTVQYENCFKGKKGKCVSDFHRVLGLQQVALFKTQKLDLQVAV